MVIISVMAQEYVWDLISFVMGFPLAHMEMMKKIVVRILYLFHIFQDVAI